MGEALKTSPRKTIKETLNDACSYFMSIGVSYDEYWYKNPSRLKHYLKAFEIKQKRLNEELWLQGYYNYIAFAYVSPILNPFAKRGTKPISYPSQPFPLTQKEIEEREEIARANRKAQLKQKLLASVKNKEVVKK